MPCWGLLPCVHSLSLGTASPRNHRPRTGRQPGSLTCLLAHPNLPSHHQPLFPLRPDLKRVTLPWLDGCLSSPSLPSKAWDDTSTGAWLLSATAWALGSGSGNPPPLALSPPAPVSHHRIPPPASLFSPVLHPNQIWTVQPQGHSCRLRGRPDQQALRHLVSSHPGQVVPSMLLCSPVMSCHPLSLWVPAHP